MQRLEVSGAVRLIYGSLGVKGLNTLNNADTETNSRIVLEKCQGTNDYLQFSTRRYICQNAHIYIYIGIVGPCIYTVYIYIYIHTYIHT